MIVCLFEKEGNRVKVVKIGWKWEGMGIEMAQAIRIEMNELLGMNKRPTNPIPLIYPNPTLFHPSSIKTNTSLSKNCIHEVYMEIISDRVVYKPLWPFLGLSLISEHHVIVPSSTHSHSNSKPSL